MSLSPLTISGLLSTALGRPAREGARVVALHWLYELVAARATWSLEADAASIHDSTASNNNDEATRALHKTRVALRRLRATLKEHRVTLDLTIGTRDARSLQRLQEATGAIRDRDVFRLWLEAQKVSGTGAREVEALRSLLHPATGPSRINLPDNFHASRSRMLISLEKPHR